MTDQLDIDPNNDGAQEPSAIEAAARPGDGPRPQGLRAAGQYVDESGTETHLIDYIKTLYKRRYLALTVFIVVVGIVVVYTFTSIPIYEARARVLIEVENPNVVGFKEVIDEQQAKADYYQTQYNILQSRSLARKTVESLKLWNSPQFVGVPGKKSFSLRGLMSSASNWLSDLFGSSPDIKDNQISAADETAVQSAVIDAFLGHLTITPLRNSRLVDIKYDLPDPALATQIANAIGTNYIEQNLEYKFLASKEATDFLDQQLTQQKKALQDAETALQRYREQNDAISLEDRENIVVQKLADLNAAVTRAKTVRIEKESLYNQLRLSQNNPSLLDTFPAILTNSFVQGLKSQLADLQRQRSALADKFGDQHPQMIAVNSSIETATIKLNAEIQKVVQSVKSEYDAALAQENSLTTALNQQKSEALSMNRKSIDYGVLEREAQSNKQIYDSLMQRAKETGVAGELRTSNIRIIDRAEQPRSPSYPRKTFNLLAAIFGGGVMAIVLAFLFEYIDSRIKTPEEIKTFLGLPHLGLLPLMTAEGAGNVYVRLDGTVPANFSEAFRVLRTNVLFSSAAVGGQSVLVTSTGPGEGKSLVASNLAISLAQAGRRVLLIDADMRKPKAHQIFEFDQEPGLSNLLVGNAKASECVRKSPTSGLWVMTAGRVPPNPAELLGSTRFRDFLGSLKSHFDWVIVDSPPVMAVADASVIAHAVTGVLFVVGAEMTSRHAARRATEQLETAQAKFFGAVLNRVDLERNAYYYSQYYRREYTAYYTKSSA